MCPDSAQKLQRSRFLLHEGKTEIYRSRDYPVDFLPKIKREEAGFFYHQPATEQPQVRVKVVVAAGR
jgi:hypothetical protein